MIFTLYFRLLQYKQLCLILQFIICITQLHLLLLELFREGLRLNQ